MDSAFPTRSAAACGSGIDGCTGYFNRSNTEHDSERDANRRRSKLFVRRYKGGHVETNTIDELLNLIREELGIEDVRPEHTFEELGMDSLDFILMIQEIRDRIGPITRQQAQECRKVSDLMKVFE
jgi:acyl carrier protein